MRIRLKSSIMAISLMSLLLLVGCRSGGESATQGYDRAGQSDSAVLGNEGSLTIPSQVAQAVALSLPKRYLDGERVDYSELLQVYVGDGSDCCENKAPIAGRYEADNKSVRFMPQFDFVEGQDYVIRVQHQSEDKGGEDKESEDKGVFHKLTPFKIQANTPVVKPEVTAIYPSGDTLPENVLRFYIHFSTPMKPHVAFDYIKLVDASGNVDDAAFMQFKQELWSEDRTRLTVLMDPGRIKRNVATNLSLGPALNQGERYQFVVEGGWPTANGTETLATFSKSFSVSDGLRELPNAENWEISAPTIGTNDTLEIKFDRPFDHQLLHKDIQVFSATGEEIQGESFIGNHETEWHFQPKEAWVEEQITIVVDSELEDVAGNNFRDLLDHSIETETRDRAPILITVDLTS
ncbi:MAG: hypothetical protein AAF702_10650 [Chloroflexota bacterium]